MVPDWLLQIWQWPDFFRPDDGFGVKHRENRAESSFHRSNGATFCSELTEMLTKCDV